MKLYTIILIFFTIIIIIFFSSSEIIRQKYTFQEKYENIDTKKAAFSLTTTPKRINYLEPTLKSLLDQNPKTIYLNIPYIYKKDNTEYIIPEWLNKYTENGSVTIVRCEDTGPSTKLLGCLDETQNNPNLYICVVDDDQIYNKNLLNNLLHKTIKYPNSVISVSVNKHIYSLVQGYCGFLAKRSMLNNLKNYKILNVCKRVDDPWFSSYFINNNINIIQLFSIYVVHSSINKSPKTILDMYKIIALDANIGSIDPLYTKRGQNEDQLCFNESLKINN